MASSTQADLNTLRDQAAAKIGQYLLQGYRMLAEHCEKCGTVKVQKQSMKPLCVLCHEILSTATTAGIPDSTNITNNNPSQEIEQQTISSSNKKITSTISLEEEQPKEETPLPVIDHTREVLLKQLSLATVQLERSESIECSVQLCRLIKECAEALKAVKNV